MLGEREDKGEEEQSALKFRADVGIAETLTDDFPSRRGGSKLTRGTSIKSQTLYDPTEAMGPAIRNLEQKRESDEILFSKGGKIEVSGRKEKGNPFK